MRFTADLERAASADSALAWLAAPRAVGLLIGLYLLAHFGLRLLLGPTLGIDDAEQMLFAQQWAWGYRFRQPPLFTWMLLTVFEMTGPGVIALSLVRYGLLALTYACLYLTAIRWITDQRLAALAVFSFALIYVFAYYAHHDLTHTTALGAMVAVSLYAFSLLAEKPTAARYALLGLCFGLGMLSKWNFVMLVAGLPLTCLLLEEYRGLVLSWKSGVLLLAMTTVVAPTWLWMAEHGQSIADVSEGILAAGHSGSDLGTFIEGTLALAKAALVFPLPFVPLFLLIFARSLRQPVQAVGASKGTRFFGLLILTALGLHLLLIPFAGAVAFTERWMHPALMALPLLAFAWLEPRRPSVRSMTIYLIAIAFLVAVVAGARLYRYARGADHCGQCRDLVPFAELATDLKSAGFIHGTIVANGLHIGGNLRMLFPDSRVINPDFPLGLWPKVKDRSGMCLMVWQNDTLGSAARHRAMADYLAKTLQVPHSAPRRRGIVTATMYGSTSRSYALGFEFLPEGEGGCR